MIFRVVLGMMIGIATSSLTLATEYRGHMGIDPNSPHGPRPPREALEACKEKSESAKCSFKGREGKEVEGTCWRPSSDKPLACKPEKKAEKN